ncbi:MAG: hypothetical protein GX588_04015 [Clostridiaceae bacterium]|nr:hypothetical protein [Clostridiaceae bacterium]
MKDNPAEKNIKHDMQPGELILDGFLGDDKRQLAEIIAADQETLQRLGVSAADLAKAMRALTRAGMRALGGQAEEGDFLVQSEEWMGWLGCPFKDAKRAAKRLTTVTKRSTGETIVWSDLHIHLIEEHGFFEGKGASHRLEPDELIRFLGLGAQVE